MTAVIHFNPNVLVLAIHLLQQIKVDNKKGIDRIIVDVLKD